MLSTPAAVLRKYYKELKFGSKKDSEEAASVNQLRAGDLDHSVSSRESKLMNVLTQKSIR